jgi:hypothetical protein
MIYNNTKPGTENNAIGNAFEQAFIKDLEDKYPCVDWMNEQVLSDAIQKLRERESATGELDEKALAELGNSVNASYIVIVRVFVLGNGQTVVSARVIDGRGAAMVADQMANSTGGDAAYNAARSVAQKLLQDLAGPFRGQCEARWTGTITYTQKTLKETNQTTNYTKTDKAEAKTVENYEHRVDVALQPMAQGSKTYFFTNGHETMTMSRVSRKLSDHHEANLVETGTVLCRPRGANSYRKPSTNRDNKVIREDGENTKTLPVEIKVYTDTGRFVVKVATPDLFLKRIEVHEGVRDDCEPKPFSETKSSERTDSASFFDFEGQIDPKNPNVLVGKGVTGTLETRQYTTTWNLRLVQPRKKQ